MKKSVHTNKCTLIYATLTLPVLGPVHQMINGFFFFRKHDLTFSAGDNSDEMLDPVFWEKIRKISSICCLLTLPRELKVKVDVNYMAFPVIEIDSF